MLRALTGEAEGSRYALQIGSFCTLVAVQSTALLLFKICQVGGTYTFSARLQRGTHRDVQVSVWRVLSTSAM